MFYVVVDRDGDVCFSTKEKNDPDIQRYLEKYAYFDAEVRQAPEVWEVRVKEEGEGYTLWSIHTDATSAIKKLEKLMLMGELRPYIYKLQ